MTVTQKHGRRYPWDEWFSGVRKGHKKKLLKDQDYNGKSYSFAHAVRLKAKAKKVPVRVLVSEDENSITIVPKDKREGRGK